MRRSISSADALNGSSNPNRPRGPRRGRWRPGFEPLEDRQLLTTYTVTSLDDAGFGTLRQVLTAADLAPGADTIDFQVAGTIRLTSGPLPAVADPVTIDGSTAPGFAGTPVVAIDANGSPGLLFNVAAAGSTLRSLAIEHARGAAVTLDAPGTTVVGNFLGVQLDGKTPAGNLGDGLVINATSHHNTIGATTTLIPNVSSDAISRASNVISGNLGNGIVLHGSADNSIVANYIGTDISGTIDLGNAGQGIMLDGGAHNNMIGGTITFNNTSGLVPDSNLISGNGGNGVLLIDGASANFLGSNFIGTNVTGNAALGNDLNGVAILDGADNNILAGTFFNMQPFVFANVISGNHQNGILIFNANNNTIHANDLGIGIDNQTPVGNTLDGIAIAGNSANTQFGGVIPLGNVSAANGQNGVEIRDTASGTVAFNTFAGLAAFELYTNLGNGHDGFLVTSTGSGNLIRTNVVSNNRANGIEITGDAQGVLVDPNIIGMNTGGQSAMPNAGDGILIGGNAHDNTIGGSLQSIIPQNIISANLGHGVAIVDHAHNNQIINSYIGTNVFGRAAFGNAGGGVFLGGNSSGTTIGGTTSDLRDLISGNRGNGIELAPGTTGNTIAGNWIGTEVNGTVPLPNIGSGVLINGSSNNLIGGPTPGSANTIAYNARAGVLVQSGTGDAILGNSIFLNQGPGIRLQAGGNQDQPAPLLTHIMRGAQATGIGGRLFAAPNSDYHLEFFADPAAGLSGPPQGQTFLGSSTVTTNNRGMALIRFFVPAPSRPVRFTATATSARHDTSPFSNAVPAQAARLAPPHRGRAALRPS